MEEEGEDGADEVGEVYYLAHHPVVCQDKQTTKVRVVYDASAKKNGGQSLNDCLYSGAPLSETIADVLVRLRSGRGVLNKVLYGEAPPRGPTPYPFIYHFIYLLLKKGTPFTYLF